MTAPNVSPETNSYAAAIIKRAVEAAKTPEEFRVPPRVYYHTHNGAKFHVDLGPGRVKTLMFANYRVVTDDKREIDQLDLVADKPGTFVYTLPDSDIAHQMAQELEQEARRDILRTAQAAAAVSNQQFDPNVPVVPVATHQPPPMVIMQGASGYNAPGTGMQNSFSGTTADQPFNQQLTTPEMQTAPPSSTAAALARLNAMTGDAAKAATA